METITCTCRTCRTNADYIGATFPLRATVPASTLSGVKTAKGRHALVRIANGPGALDAATRRAMNISAA